MSSMMKKHTFSKEERLCSKRLIDDLFQRGSSFFLYPYRVVFIRTGGLEPKIQVLFSVSKRRYPLAVHRNLLKRRMREAYRLQKGAILYSALHGQQLGLAVAIQYVSKDQLDFPFLYAKMTAVLEKLRDEAL
jgi:ribonuclease P protein component